MDNTLLLETEQPEGFEYPTEFLRFLELRVSDLDPWRLLEGDLLRGRHAGLREKYPSARLVPFASRYDRDDVACFDASRLEVPVVVIHEGASPGWERRAEFESFRAWLHAAVDDALDF